MFIYEYQGNDYTHMFLPPRYYILDGINSGARE